MLPTVLLLGVERALLEGDEDLRVRAAPADADAADAPGGGSAPVDAVVVAADEPQHLSRLQTWHRTHPDAAAVLVLPAGDPSGVRRALTYSPGVPADVEVVERGDRTLVDVVRAAASRSARTRRHRAVVQVLLTQPEAPGPRLRPTVDALTAVLDRAPLGFVVLDDAHGLVSWNGRAGSLLGLAAADVGVALPDLLRGDDVARELAAVAEHGEAFSAAVTAWPVRSPGTVLEVNAVRTELADGRPGSLLLLLDVSVQRAAEAARDELHDRLRVVRRSQEFLLRASDVLVRGEDHVTTLQGLAAVAVPTLGDVCIIDVLEDGRFHRLAAQHADPAQQPLVDVLRTHYTPSADGSHPAALAVRDRRAQCDFHVDVERLAGMARDERQLDVVRRLDFTGWISVPLVAAGEVVGVVTLVSCGDSRRLGPDDVVLADELAGRVAQVVARSRRYAREHEIAAALQRSMLTALPDLGPVGVAARYVPARSDTQVGGDWYDAFVQPGASPVLVIGDVVGHDLTAATAMGQARNALRALAWGRSDRPAEVLTALDDFNAGVRITDFATVLYAVLEAHDGGGALLRWASAGHLPPLVVRADGTAAYLQAPHDPVIGVPPSPSRPRRQHEAELPSGSTLLLYTDGLVERRTEPLSTGLEELRRVAEGLGRLPLEDVCDAVLTARAGAREDDIAVLAVRVP